MRMKIRMTRPGYDAAARSSDGTAHTALHRVPLAVGLASACLLGCSGRPDAPAAQPTQTAGGLACAAPSWDLGEVLVKGGALDFDHTFRLENRSEKTLKLQEVRSDCGCLVAKDYARTIEPGGETEIKVTISVFGPPGPFRKTITVQEESEPNEAIRLSVVGSRAVSDLLYGTPPTINFGTMARGDSKTKQLVLSRYDGSAVNFLALTAEDQSLSLDGEPTRYTTVDRLGTNIDCVELPVRLDLKSQPVGPFKSKVRVRTESSDQGTAELDVAVNATIVEETTPWVESVFANRLERGAAVELPMTNRGQPADCPEILSAAYEGDDSIQVEVVHASPARGPASPPRVRISRPADSAASGLARGTLSLRTKGPADRPTTRIGIAAFLPQ